MASFCLIKPYEGSRAVDWICIVVPQDLSLFTTVAKLFTLFLSAVLYLVCKFDFYGIHVDTRMARGMQSELEYCF